MALGFSRILLPKAAPRAACAGSGSASQPYGESESEECSRYLLSPTSRKAPPAAVPRSLPARCRRGRGRQRPWAGSAGLGSAGLGSARRHGAGGEVGALAKRTAPGAAPTPRPVGARGLC